MKPPDAARTELEEIIHNTMFPNCPATTCDKSRVYATADAILAFVQREQEHTYDCKCGAVILPVTSVRPTVPCPACGGHAELRLATRAERSGG